MKMHVRGVRIAATILGGALLLALASGVRYRVQIVSSTGETAPLVIALVPSGAHLVQPGVPRLRLEIDPAPAVMPSIRWSASNGKLVQLMQGVPWVHMMALPNDSFSTPAPPENEINAIPGDGSGVTWITADVGAPVSERVSIPAYVYHALAVGCAFGFRAGARFDGKPAKSIAESDIYAIGPAPPPMPFGGCPPGFTSSAVTRPILRVPYGGATFPSAQFTRVSVHDWHGAFTQVPSGAAGGLIFKTRTGQIVKVQYLRGATVAGASEVAAPGEEFADVTALRNAHTRLEPIGARGEAATFSVRIGYQSPIATTTGIASTLFAQAPFDVRTPFFFTRPSARVFVSPQPYARPTVRWFVDGKFIGEGPMDLGQMLRADRPGTATLSAQIGAPVSKTASIRVITYDSLVVGCGVDVQGVRFTGGRAVRASDARSSDLFVSSDPDRFACAANPSLYFPGGGIFLTNGGDSAHNVPRGASAAPQFPELNARSWRNRSSKLTIDAWRSLVEPCTVPLSPGVVRFDYNCKTLPARTLLFRTRAGAYVKLLLVDSNGTSIMGGPYQVLRE